MFRVLSAIGLACVLQGPVLPPPVHSGGPTSYDCRVELGERRNQVDRFNWHTVCEFTTDGGLVTVHIGAGTPNADHIISSISDVLKRLPTAILASISANEVYVVGGTGNGGKYVWPERVIIIYVNNNNNSNIRRPQGDGNDNPFRVISHEGAHAQSDVSYNKHFFGCGFNPEHQRAIEQFIQEAGPNNFDIYTSVGRGWDGSYRKNRYSWPWNVAVETYAFLVEFLTFALPDNLNSKTDKDDLEEVLRIFIEKNQLQGDPYGLLLVYSQLSCLEDSIRAMNKNQKDGDWLIMIKVFKETILKELEDTSNGPNNKHKLQQMLEILRKYLPNVEQEIRQSLSKNTNRMWGQNNSINNPSQSQIKLHNAMIRPNAIQHSTRR